MLAAAIRRGSWLATAVVAAVLAGCGSAASVTSSPPARASATGTVDTTTQAFVSTTRVDRAAYLNQFNVVLADCPFPTANNTIIAPADLDPCGPALDGLVSVTLKYQADLSALTVPPQFASGAQVLRDGLATTLTSVAEFMPVDHSRDVGVVGPSTSRMWDAHLAVENGLSQ